jgi:hypothetical protein
MTSASAGAEAMGGEAIVLSYFTGSLTITPVLIKFKPAHRYRRGLHQKGKMEK